MGRTTNKQRRAVQADSARERAAAARLAQRQREQRRRALSIIGSVIGVAAVVAVIAVIAITHKTSNDPRGNRQAAAPAVVQQVSSVSQATLDGIGKGSTAVMPTKIGDPPLTANGKPELLYIGGEFCPLCAAERWSLVQALSKFGTFSGLSQIRSATADGNIATFSFYKSGYTSKYVTFTPVENEDRNHAELQKLTSSQNAIFTKYTNGYPFLDFGGQYMMKTVGYDPSVLGTQNQAQIAAQLNNPKSKVAKAVDGEANVLTATICKMTNNQPSTVCSAGTVPALQSKLGA